MADINVGDNAVLRMEVVVVGGSTSPSSNSNDLYWRLSLVERTAQGFGWSSGGIAASVEVFWDGGGYLVAWQGTFGFDFRPGGAQTKVIAEGTLPGMGNLPDGSPRTFTFRGNMGNTGTSTAGGPGSVDQQIAGPATKLVPPVPTNVTAERLSDSQTRVTWDNGGPSNGRATQNQYQAATPNTNGDGLVIIDAATSVTTAILANEKKQYHVRAGNDAGWSAWSAWSNTVYTTPAAPTKVQAAKTATGDITVTFTDNAYDEANHQVWHGVVNATTGAVTWDAAALATIGTTSYTHANPDSSKLHTYRVRATQGTLNSAFAQSNTVQLLAAPNKPSVPALPSGVDRAKPFVYSWQHNPTDTTPQAAYEVSYSTNGGTDWQTTGRVASTLSSYTIPANSYPANTSLTLRVRTWGSATTGGADDTGASPWSTLRTVVFKTQPVVTITTPANGATLNSSVLIASLGFVQAEQGIFTKAEFELLRNGNVLETRESTTRFNVRFDTQLLNQATYVLRARAKDDNGLYSEWVSNTFSVQYLAPAPGVGTVSYLEESGFAQITLTIADPTAGQAEAVAVSVTRRIGSDTETVVARTSTSGQLTFFDTTPTINGTNYYTVTTESAQGAKASSSVTLVTNELRRAFLSKGSGFTEVGVFGADISINDKPSIASATVSAAGRSRPVGMFGTEATMELKVTSFIYEGFGSTIQELRDLLLLPGKACYRDASGRRLFGVAQGSISYKDARRGTLSLSFEETS